jgi:site-specific DNA-methyltransferase (adenine-specific)
MYSVPGLDSSLVIRGRIWSKVSQKQNIICDESGKEVAHIFNLDVIAFLKTLPDASVDLIVTDPAYSGMNQHLALGKGRIVGSYAKSKTDKWFDEFHDTPENYLVFLEECKRVLKDDRHIFVMFDSYSLITLGPIFREVFNLKNIITWDKIAIGMGHYYRRRSELILFGSKGKRPLTRRDIPDIWAIKRIHNAAYPTQKPVEIFKAMIASSFAVGDSFSVCDPFSGSGSSGVATLQLGGTFIGNDISKRAYDLVSERLTAVATGLGDPLQLKPATIPSGLKEFWND